MTSSKRDTRAAAALALAAVARDGQSLTHALNVQTPLIAERDQGLLQELCFGVARYAAAYELLSKKLLSTPIKKKETEVKMLLFLGFYQLEHTRIPDHAAINSVVEASKKLKKQWSTKLINGVLRRFMREREELTAGLSQNPCYEFAHPQWLIDQLRKAWPEHWQQILKGNNEHPPLTLRVNERQQTRDAYSEKLKHQQANHIHTSCEHSGQGLTLEQASDITTLPGYSEGMFAVQDEAAQLSADLLHLQPGQRVLDACCAPGGKTCHILEHEPELQEVVAIDLEANRMERVAQNLERLQLKSHQAQSAGQQDQQPQVTLTVADAADTEAWWDGQPFDRILLDAPCSATGVIRRHPDIKLLRRPTDIAQLAELQQKLLHKLWPTLKPGGIMVYATCSVLPQENERSVATFIEQTEDASHLPLLDKTWGLERPFGRQLFPQTAGHDGFYYCVLKKA